jgi:hypothetical protein
MSAQTHRAEGRAGVRLWPWPTSTAVLATIASLVALFVIFAVIRATTDWPASEHEGWVVLGIALLSVVPIVLLILDVTARNSGQVSVLGVSLSFASASQEAATTVRTETLDANLGNDSADVIERSSLPVVVKALRSARDLDVTVVDLRAGATWWESRLFILVAGAAQRGRPSAIAFVGDGNGERRQFVGWAPPTALLRLHVASDEALATALRVARAENQQWAMGAPVPGITTAVDLPTGTRLFLPSEPDEVVDPEFAMELFLNRAIMTHANEALKRPVTVPRLLELYTPALITDHIAVGASDQEWIELLRAKHRQFFAVTSSGESLKTLVPREALVTALVTRLAESAADGGATRR